MPDRVTKETMRIAFNDPKSDVAGKRERYCQ